MSVIIFRCSYERRSLFILLIIICPVFILFNGPPNANVTETKPKLKKLETLSFIPDNSEKRPRISSRILSNTSEDIRIPYTTQQSTSINLTSKNLFFFNSSYSSNISLESTPKSSSFNIHSVPIDENFSWKNNVEPDYGEVEVFKNLTDPIPHYRLNFSENNVTPVSGITNIDFNVTTNPFLCNYSTKFSFGYRIPFFDSRLVDEVHSLVLELRFNNGSLNFILADKGSHFGDPLEPSIYKPGSNALYILCNESDQSNWITNTYNISHLITRYFLPSEYSMFSQINSVFCYMFAFIPEFDVSLDIMGINYTSTLLPNESSVTYHINDVIIHSENVSLKYDLFSDNVSIQVIENSLWNSYQSTQFNLTITRTYEEYCSPSILSWNNSFVQISMNLSIPHLFLLPLSSHLLFKLPIDWTFLENSNNTASFEILENSEIPPDDVTRFFYRFSTENNNYLVLRFETPNYVETVTNPTIISSNEWFQISGKLLHSIPGILNLYLMNQTIFYYDTTVCMLNGSFLFPMGYLDDQFPTGAINLLVNLSSQYQFGFYQQIVHIYSEEIENYQIKLHTPENMEVFQYDPLFINLSLYKNHQQYLNSDILVIAVLNDFIHEFDEVSNGFYNLIVNHIIWPPQKWNLTIIASNGVDFHASKKINLTIFPVQVSWDIQGIPENLNPNDNISIHVNMYITPHEGGTNWPLCKADLKVWINNTLMQYSQTDNFGYANIFIPTNGFNSSKLLNMILVAQIEDKILKMNTTSISVSTNSTPYDRIQPLIDKIGKTPIKSNSTFYHIYNVTYPINGTSWYISLNKFLNKPITAYLIRNDFVFELDVNDQSLTWDLSTNPFVNDTLVVEFQGPTVLSTVSEDSLSYEIHIECLSNGTIMNYSIVLELDFIKFPLKEIYIRDFLNRDITSKFEIEIIDSFLYLRNLSIISNVAVEYFVLVHFEVPAIDLLTNLKELYAYNESIIGRWRFSTTADFSFRVIYTLQDEYVSECRNTTLQSLMNDTYIVEAFFQNFKWNSTVIVAMELKFSDETHSISSEQTFTIMDPFSPKYSYYLDSNNNDIYLHLFTSEPELSSGVKEITCTYLGSHYSPIKLTSNHHLIEFQNAYSQNGKINVTISDWAGNTISFYIDLMLEMDSRRSRSIIDPTIFLPSIFSLLVISAIFSFRFIRKRQNAIL